MNAGDVLVLLTAISGVALLVVLVVRTVLKEIAVGRRSTDSVSARTERVRLLDFVAIALTVLTVAGAIARIVVGLTG
ncbi:hypothetical protein FHX82_003678 [Amycolatopsis bartoniae]|uniref:Uncharacterized protein n=1 Tax=Amycolatopsis bartoniae TaxID=941986 RepID=A0A8H9MF30_9PSEU|nr:hypothetical protein [Amycolatopsis bartoniae]MBB2936614.1 hypothetical protein [Amycolatopsis bartoniae]TVT09800.1 hypothetical protein FNH07_07640 [Amycolatopsis bartoniae]GHF67657.1 hypothetical protein GCM10017566_46730 [Amycolatopsis bartoniae]